MEELIWLDRPAGRDVAQTGSKAANLSRLAGDFPVPPGFCLTTAAFAKWCAGPAPGELLPSLKQALLAAYNRLAERLQTPEPRVAVRSSGVDEDGQGTSFAGQYETFLNIVGTEALSRAVVRCWESAKSARVQSYRELKGEARAEDRMAVLIQAMVPADVSAVVFSVDPVNQNQNEILINATWGLGESLVGGTVTPDSYRLSKSELSVTERSIAEKQRMTIQTDGGVSEVTVPRPMQRQATLSDIQAIEMARLARVLEERMGWPVDLECAYHAGKIYLLQCRPVTTLSSRQ